MVCVNYKLDTVTLSIPEHTILFIVFIVDVLFIAY